MNSMKKLINLPKISIITANLNGALTLERTIKSIISQGYRELEYIFVDGGSTDGSLEIVNCYKENIDVLIVEKDNGISDAYNKGIEKATGELIGIISSDDFLADNILTNIANSYLENYRPDVIYGNAGHIEDGKTRIVRPDSINTIRDRQPLKHSSVFVTKNAYEKWGKFSVKFRYAMDYELVLRLYINGAKFVYLNKTLSFFSAGGVNQRAMGKTIREVHNITVKYGFPKWKADLVLSRKIMKYQTKKILKTFNLYHLISIYKYFHPRYIKNT